MTRLTSLRCHETWKDLSSTNEWNVTCDTHPPTHLQKGRTQFYRTLTRLYLFLSLPLCAPVKQRYMDVIKLIEFDVAYIYSVKKKHRGRTMEKKTICSFAPQSIKLLWQVIYVGKKKNSVGSSRILFSSFWAASPLEETGWNEMLWNTGGICESVIRI